MKWLIAIICLLVASFSAFGFLATYEPAPNAMAFRVGYGVLLIVCVLGLAFSLIPRSKR